MLVSINLFQNRKLKIHCSFGIDTQYISSLLIYAQNTENIMIPHMQALKIALAFIAAFYLEPISEA